MANGDDLQLLRVEVTRLNANLDMGRLIEQRRSLETDELIYDRNLTELAPTLQVSLKGSVLHPYFLEFDFSGEGGLIFEKETLGLPATGEPERRRSDKSPLQLYHLRASLLREKPYSLMIFADKADVRRHNDFFTRVDLDREMYGASLLGNEGRWPWALTWRRIRETETDTLPLRDLAQDEIDFSLSNSRGRAGRTTLSYRLEDFVRNERFTPTYEGVRQTGTLLDHRYTTSHRLHLMSYLYYNDVDASSAPSRTFTWRERLTARHAETLRSVYEYSYASRSAGVADSENQEGRASLIHQLYESLQSTLTADARTTEDTGRETRRYGGGVSEVYTKMLGAWCRLKLGAAMHVHPEERQASGDASTIIDERHVMRTSEPSLLRHPGVILPSIRVTDTTRTVFYREFVDYLITPRGFSAEIVRVVGGRIPEGNTVLVTYTVEGGASDSFVLRQGRFSFLLTLFNGLAEVYGRRNTIEHSGGESLRLEDLTDDTIGVAGAWRILRLGAEYRNYDSTIAPFVLMRTFESLVFQPWERCTLRLDAEQRRTEYPDTDEVVRSQSYIARLQARLTRALSLLAEAGTYSERGRNDPSLDRDLISARIDLRYWVGRTTMGLGYEYRDEDYLRESRKRSESLFKLNRKF